MKNPIQQVILGFVNGILLLFVLGNANAQTVVNDDFTAGSASWTDCANPTEIMGTSQWHGGPSPYTPNNFAEIDGHLDMIAGTLDDMTICQSIPGFTVGNTYEICMDVQRRPGPSNCTTSYNQPGTVTMTTTFDGGALNVNTSQSNTTWGWTTVCYTFTATLPTQLLALTPNDNSTCGMLVTNITVAPIIVLPIELVSFDVLSDGNSVELNWITNSERDNDYFTIERSQNANDWQAISHANGAGNSQIPIEYQSIDMNPLQGESYYRLKQTDFHGDHSYAQAVSINRNSSPGYTLFPNPTKDVIHLTKNNLEDCVVQVMNLLGEEVSKTNLHKSTSAEISLPNQRGTYLVQVTIGEVVTITKVNKL
ncbi:MAG: hypothetical protein ACI865_001349 [Flavobacteriaceae bacterium]|jgi:hypothetical protein